MEREISAGGVVVRRIRGRWHLAAIEPRGRKAKTSRAGEVKPVLALPKGLVDAGERPEQTALREVREETGLDVELERLTGVYYHADHAAGEFIHFVFRGRLPGVAEIRPQATEVAEWAFFAPDSLPEPMSPSTRLRLLDALADRPPVLPVTLPPRAE